MHARTQQGADIAGGGQRFGCRVDRERDARDGPSGLGRLHGEGLRAYASSRTTTGASRSAVRGGRGRPARNASADGHAKRGPAIGTG
ncbi:hypothetical protein BURMUCF2_A0881 [Burkholderia multivorans CF2]|nr:hypothetical protein BURMUCF2_A0881 [Burkholderia multivorans CF2]